MYFYKSIYKVLYVVFSIYKLCSYFYIYHFINFEGIFVSFHGLDALILILCNLDTFQYFIFYINILTKFNIVSSILY